MQKIKIPEDVDIKDPSTGEVANTIKFVDWICYNRLNDAKIFGATSSALIASADMKILFRKPDDNGYVYLDDSNYNLLLSSVKTPSVPYSPEIMSQAVSFLKAVINAEEVKEND